MTATSPNSAMPPLDVQDREQRSGTEVSQNSKSEVEDGAEEEGQLSLAGEKSGTGEKERRNREEEADRGVTEQRGVDIVLTSICSCVRHVSAQRYRVHARRRLTHCPTIRCCSILPATGPQDGRARRLQDHLLPPRPGLAVPGGIDASPRRCRPGTGRPPPGDRNLGAARFVGRGQELSPQGRQGSALPRRTGSTETSWKL